MRIITLITSVIIAFIMMPFAIDRLGDRWYGMWVVIGSLITYYSLLDIGLSAAVQRFLSIAIVKEDKKDFNEILVTSIRVFMYIGFTGVIITIIVLFLAGMFFINEEELNIFQYVFGLMGVAMSISFPIYAFNGVIISKMRYDISSFVEFLLILFQNGLFFLALINGYSIVSLALITVLTTLLRNITITTIAFRLVPWIDIRWSNYKKERVSDIYSIAVLVFLTYLATIVRMEMDNFILAGMVGFVVVTHFNIASRMSAYFLQIIMAALNVTLPLFSKYYADGDNDKGKDALFFSIKVGLIISVMGAGVIVIFGQTFIELWMGKEYLDAYIPLVILIVTFMFSSIDAPIAQMLLAMGQYKTYSIFNLIEVSCNVILSFLLVSRMGVIGVVLGTSIPMLLNNLIIKPFYIGKVLHLDVKKIAWQITRTVAVVVFIQAPMFLYSLDEVINSYTSILICILVYYPVATFIASMILLTKDEKKIILNLI